MSLLRKYGLLGTWKEENWPEKKWSKLVMVTLNEGAKAEGTRAGWAEEIARRGDLGAYTLKHKELCQAKYIKGRNGNDTNGKWQIVSI